MFTVCPKCTLTLAVTAIDLRVGQGYVRCGRCANVFNALLTLSEEPSESGSGAGGSPPSPSGTGSQPSFTGSWSGSGPTRSQALPAGGPKTHLATEQSFDGSIENESSRAEGTGTFETILLEGDAITQTEEFVPEESVDSELEALTMRLGVPAHELSAASEDDASEDDASADDASAADASAADAASNDVAAADAAALDLAPAGLRHPRPRRWLWGAGSILMVLLLSVQAIHHWRDSLAQSPLLNRPLSRLYASIGLPLNPRWNLSAYDLRQLGATADPEDGKAIHVRLSLANRAARAQPMPLLRLTLLDRYGKSIAARELAPSEYLPRGQAPRSFLGSDERIDSEITVRDPGSDSASFELDVCLRLQGRLRCAGDALAGTPAVAASKS
jgi:predicted Zn finger-like uncharacterized protein